jgi:hypothetical protein
MWRSLQGTNWSISSSESKARRRKHYKGKKARVNTTSAHVASVEKLGQEVSDPFSKGLLFPLDWMCVLSHASGFMDDGGALMYEGAD